MSLAQLCQAYVRRKQWEARLLAVAVVKALDEAMSPGGGPSGRRVGLDEFKSISGA